MSTVLGEWVGGGVVPMIRSAVRTTLRSLLRSDLVAELMHNDRGTSTNYTWVAGITEPAVKTRRPKIAEIMDEECSAARLYWQCICMCVCVCVYVLILDRVKQSQAEVHKQSYMNAASVNEICSQIFTDWCRISRTESDKSRFDRSMVETWGAEFHKTTAGSHKSDPSSSPSE